MNIRHQIISYIKYRIKSKKANGKSVHSPYIKHLCTEIISEKEVFIPYRIEAIRRIYLKSKDKITPVDYGAGSHAILSKKNISVKSVAKYSSIHPKYGRLLGRLVQNLKPEMIIEAGTSLGLSTLYMAAVAPAAMIYTIEGNESKAEIAKKQFFLLRYSNVKVCTGNFDVFLPKLLQNVKHPLFIFIDGNHRYEPTISYFEMCVAKAMPDTVIVFDDIHWSKEMEKAWSYICNHSSVSATVDLYYMGIVFFNLELQKENYIIRF